MGISLNGGFPFIREHLKLTWIGGTPHDLGTPPNIHRIGWWENLQETPILDGKNNGFL